MSRNRIIYQSEALFVGPTTGGYAGQQSELHRVQDISHDMSITRTDIFEFGRLAALDRVMIEPPTVTLDFSYLLTNGDNEANMGLEVAAHSSVGITDTLANATALFSKGTFPNMISGLIANMESGGGEKNYYVVTVPEGVDADGDNTVGTAGYNNHSIVGFGNGVLSNYTVNAAVGDFPSASVSVEAYNVSFISGNTSPLGTNGWISGNALPSINKGNNSIKQGAVVIPDSTTGKQGVFALRPGDITFNFNEAASDGAVAATNPLAVGGAVLPTGAGRDQDPDADTETATQAEPVHIQNFSLDAALTRTPLTRLGSTFPYYRPIDFPLTCNMNVSAYLADVTTGSLVDLLCSDNSRNIAVNMRIPCSKTDTVSSANTELKFVMKNAKLSSQNFAATIGDTKTVDLVFEGQWGGSNDTTNGIFISGTANNAS